MATKANPNANKNKTPTAKVKDASASPPGTNFGAIPAGVLNPNFFHTFQGIRVDPRNTSSNAFTMMREAMKKAGQSEPIGENTGPLRGIVLRVESTLEDDGKSNDRDWWSHFFDSDYLPSDEIPKMVQLRVRIPELHVFLPTPMDAHDGIIDLYPIYTSQDSFVGSQEYEVGDIVVVDHENKKTLEGGVLLGPLMKGIPTGPVANNPCEPVAFNPNVKANVKGKKDKSKKTGHTGKKAGKRDNRLAVLIAGAGNGSNKSDYKGLLAHYFYSKGYALIGKQGFSPAQAAGSSLGGDFTITPKGTDSLSELVVSLDPQLKKDPNIVVIQFDRLFASDPASTSRGEAIKQVAHVIKNAISHIRANAKSVTKIIFIGTLKQKWPSLSLDPWQYNGDASDPKSPNDILTKGTGTGIGQDSDIMLNLPKVVMVDPIASAASSKGWPTDFSSLNASDMARNSAKKFGNIPNAKGTPSKTKTPSKPVDKTDTYDKLMSEAQLGNPKTRAEGTQTLKVIASRLGYSTDDSPPKKNAAGQTPPWWKDLIKRDFANNRLTEEEVAKIMNQTVANLKAMKGVDPNTIMQILSERLSFRITEAKDAYNKADTVNLPKDTSKDSAPAQHWMCDENGNWITVPAGSTFKAPANYKFPKNSLSGRVRERQNARIPLVLTIWPSMEHFIAQEGSGWEAALYSFDAVSLKLVNGASYLTKNNRTKKNIQWLKRLSNNYGFGKGIHGWGFHYMRDIRSATEEATLAAQAATTAGVSTYWVNCEKHFMGVEDQPPTMDPSGAAMQFAAVFKDKAPGIALIYNGYQSAKIPAKKKVGIPERNGLSDAAIQAYDGFGPMNYGTRIGTIANKYIKRAARVRKLKVPYCPMHGNGRISKKGGIWGWSNSVGDPKSPKYNKRRSKEGDGLMALAKKFGKKGDWIAFWYGSGAGAVCTDGNAANPPLTKVAENIHAGNDISLAVGTSKGALAAGAVLGSDETLQDGNGSPP